MRKWIARSTNRVRKCRKLSRKATGINDNAIARGINNNKNMYIRKKLNPTNGRDPTLNKNNKVLSHNTKKPEVSNEHLHAIYFEKKPGGCIHSFQK